MNSVVIIATTILSLIIALFLTKKLVYNFFKTSHLFEESREKTLARALNNTIKYVLYFISIIIILETLGLDITGILAGAGIIGLLVGLSAKNLFTNLFAGFMIILNDDYRAGEYVEINGYSGTVESITLGQTVIDHWTGKKHTIPNRTISTITNYSRENSVAYAYLTVKRSQSFEEISNILTDNLQHMFMLKDVLEPPSIDIEDINDNSIIIRIVCKTKPNKHWGVARIIKKELSSIIERYELEEPLSLAISTKEVDAK